MRGQQVVYDALARLNIRFDAVEHEAVFTIEEMERLPFPPGVEIAKNLFLRDAKGKRHFLVVLRKDRKADLGALAEKLGTSRLSFGSEDRLRKHLNLEKGAVSPFGLLNNADKTVELVLDGGLAECGLIGVHPNDNTATLVLSYPDLFAVLETGGHTIHYY